MNKSEMLEFFEEIIKEVEKDESISNDFILNGSFVNVGKIRTLREIEKLFKRRFYQLDANPQKSHEVDNTTSDIYYKDYPTEVMI